MVQVYKNDDTMSLKKIENKHPIVLAKVQSEFLLNVKTDNK